MRRIIKHYIKLGIGWFLLLLGIAGLVLPVLQGWLFIIMGMLVLAPEVPFIDRLLKRLLHRFPRLEKKLDHVRTRLHRYGIG